MKMTDELKVKPLEGFKGWTFEETQGVSIINLWCLIPRDECSRVRKRNRVTQWLGWTLSPAMKNDSLIWKAHWSNPFSVLFWRIHYWLFGNRIEFL